MQLRQIRSILDPSLLHTLFRHIIGEYVDASQDKEEESQSAISMFAVMAMSSSQLCIKGNTIAGVGDRLVILLSRASLGMFFREDRISFVCSLSASLSGIVFCSLFDTCMCLACVSARPPFRLGSL